VREACDRGVKCLDRNDKKIRGLLCAPSFPPSLPPSLPPYLQGLHVHIARCAHILLDVIHGVGRPFGLFVEANQDWREGGREGGREEGRGK